MNLKKYFTVKFYHRLFISSLALLFLIQLYSCCSKSDSDSLPIYVDFEASPIGDYSPKKIRTDWPNSKMLWGKKDRVEYTLGLTPKYAEILDHKGNRVLRVNYPANVYGPLVGSQWKSAFHSVDEAVLQYKVFFPVGFDFAKGGKLPGLAGGKGNAGGQVPNGYDGWSARLMFHEHGEVAYYLYYPDQKTEYGEYHFWKLDSTEIQLPVGRWVEFTHYLRMNNPKQRDGKLCAWIDGVKVLSIDSLRFRDTSALAIDHILFSTFYGGDSPEWAPYKDTYILFDDFCINIPDSTFVISE